MTDRFLTELTDKVVVKRSGADYLAAVDIFTRSFAGNLVRHTQDGEHLKTFIPGFFPGEHNRRLLTIEHGSLTSRGEATVTVADGLAAFSGVLPYPG